MTQVFAPQEGPRVFGLPPGVDFSKALVEGLDARLRGQPPEAIARVTIWVNTQRARRSLEALYSGGPMRLLPRIRVITELDLDPLAPVDPGEPVPKLRQKIELARLVKALISAEPDFAAETASFDLADSLSDLLGELQGEAIEPGRLAEIDAGAHAAHWERSLRFLGVLSQYAADAGADTQQGRLRAVADGWAGLWGEAPVADPVIVAGSTGSRAPTRAFMAAVAALPQGAVVLPGFDFDLPGGVWERLRDGNAANPDHPQYGFSRLAGALGLDLATVRAWHDVGAPDPARNAVVSLAMRPAPITDQWLTEGAALKNGLAGAFERVTWINAADARGEARAIALLLRGAAEAGRKAALVTPDRSLARRVTNELDRWRLIPDDSAGRPLALTPPGILLRDVADLLGAEVAAERLLTLLKHPLVNAGARREHMALAERLELDLLRGREPVIDWRHLAEWAADTEGAAEWVAWLEAALAGLAGIGTETLNGFAAAHREAVEALAAGPGVWDKEAGRKTLELIEALERDTEAFGQATAAEYRSLLMSQMAAVDVPEEAVVTNEDIAIWGTLEARVQSPDLVILGGLNEGVWPKQPGADPWLSRVMRRELGLPSPELQIGLSAHDFQQAIAAREVVLTRAGRDADAPAVASRWLLRLENLLNGLGDAGEAALAAARRRGNDVLAQAALLDQPEERVPPARRPSPKPPVDKRPGELSVTQVETLVRDPYAIYAHKVLGLRALDAPGRVPDALLRGTAIHAVLERFVAETRGELPEGAEEVLLGYIREGLEAAVPWASVRALWTARLQRSAEWFVDGERARRARAEPLAREVRGAREITGLPCPFRLTARADRVDRSAEGRYAIYDYKSERVPSEREARAFHLQLPLEAAIAESGGFEGLPPGPALHLELIGVGSRASRELPSDGESVAETLARLKELIAFYQEPDNGFTARLRPQKITFESDYDHLSRRGEWSDSDEA